MHNIGSGGRERQYHVSDQHSATLNTLCLEIGEKYFCNGTV